MFEGFKKTRIRANGVVINVVHRGDHAPLLLLHGYPQTHVEWHKVAPRLAEHYTVVAPDLRGYGDQREAPCTRRRLERLLQRATAQDQVEVMAALGFDSFHVVATTEGARRPSTGARPSPARAQPHGPGWRTITGGVREHGQPIAYSWSSGT